MNQNPGSHQLLHAESVSSGATHNQSAGHRPEHGKRESAPGQHRPSTDVSSLLIDHAQTTSRLQTTSNRFEPHMFAGELSKP